MPPRGPRVFLWTRHLTSGNYGGIVVVTATTVCREQMIRAGSPGNQSNRKALMKIAIIGTGNVGSALGGSFVRAGHDVTFAAQDGEKARKVAGEVGASAAASSNDAVRGADVIVLAVPYASAGSVADEIATAARGKVVVDATNPLNADYSGLSTEGGPSGAERIAAKLDGAFVVKAFNTLFASIQADPGAGGQIVDGLLAGDDAASKSTVAELERSIGLRPVDAGSLQGARQLEALAWLNISMQLRTNGAWNT
ncbi:MAG: NADPH-dependent F420 reductase, partial [Candidatus Limnocylindrales bacterium]